MNATLVILLLILSGGSFLWGFDILTSAKSALHEIEAFLLFLIAAVLLSGCAITAAIGELTSLAKGESKKPPTLKPLK